MAHADGIAIINHSPGYCKQAYLVSCFVCETTLLIAVGEAEEPVLLQRAATAESWLTKRIASEGCWAEADLT